MHTVAFIGLGRMGGAMARRLAAADFTVRAYDPSETALDRVVEAGASAAASAIEAAKGADVVMTSLPTPELLVETYAAEGGALIGNAQPGALFVDVSTIDPQTARQLTSITEHAGARFIACPVGMGPNQAEEGIVPLYVGADEDAIMPLREIFDTIGGAVHLFGTPEAATSFKLLSNLVGVGNFAVLLEGYQLGLAAGIPAQALADALAGTGGASYQLELRLPWVMQDDFTPRFSVDLALKDLRLAIDSAARAGVPVPMGAQTLQALSAAAGLGFGGEDVGAITKTRPTVAHPADHPEPTP